MLFLRAGQPLSARAGTMESVSRRRERAMRAEDLRTGAVINGWTLVERLGGGGNGVVWRVRHQDGSTTFAIKILKGARSASAVDRGRFADEIAFLSDAPGPGVLPLFDSHLADSGRDLSWYVMPLATPLLTALGSNPKTETVLDIVASIAETLARLDARQIWHRDIKPDNLFILDDLPAIGDFGLVTFPGKNSHTGPERKLGPANYHAPEMLTHPDTASYGPADVWSLAKTLWVLLTGEPYPWPGEYRQGTPYSLRIPRIGNYSWIAELDELIIRCTRLQPEARPTMAELAQELRACLAEPPEIRPQAGVAALRERVVALTAAALNENRQANERVQHHDKARQDLDSLHSEIYGHLYAMLAGTFREHPGQQEPNDAVNLLPRTAMPACQHSRGVLLTSPDQPSRLAVHFSVYARKDHGSEIIHLAADLRVLHQHQGVHHAEFEWNDNTYAVPLGSAQFARALETIKAAVYEAERDCLTAVDQILNLAPDHIPAWARPGRV
jgi:serine/threonine protein kinase